jgi:hypothetical protein
MGTGGSQTYNNITETTDGVIIDGVMQIQNNNIQFLRPNNDDDPVSAFINYQYEGLLLGEERGGDLTYLQIGQEDITMKTLDTERLLIKRDGNIEIKSNAVYVGESGDGEATIYMSGGAPGDSSYNHSVIATRAYETDTEKTELFLGKFNDASTSSGKDRIRLKGAEIGFDVYSTITTSNIDSEMFDEARVMTISNDGATINGTLTCNDIAVNNKKTYFWKVSNQTFSFREQGDENPKDEGGYLKFSIPNDEWKNIADDALLKITIHGTMKLGGTKADSYFFILNALHHSPYNYSSGYLKKNGFAFPELTFDSYEVMAVRSTDYTYTLPNFPFIYITTKSLLVDYVLTHNNTDYQNDIVSGTEPFDFYFTTGKLADFGNTITNTDDDIICEEMDIVIEVDSSSANPYQGTLSVIDLHA